MTMDQDSDDDFPMIEVKKMNETETRLFALLFNLMKEPKGISFQRFRKIMPRYYHNEDIDSDRKKLYRDLGQLKSMGFNIKVANFGFQSEDHYPYYLEKETLDQILKFTKPELEYLSILLCSQSNFENEVLLSLSQKLFSKSIELYPKGIKIHRQKISDSKETDSDLTKIIQALKDKRALVITYGRDKKERTIEPYRLIRKRSEDFYLLAFDRSKKDLRRFILPRIRINKELKEDFISQKKITSDDLNFHPLAFVKGLSDKYTLEISPTYLESFLHYLRDFDYKKEDRMITIQTSNPEALFPFFLKSPEALQEGSSPGFKASYKKYLQSLAENYTFAN
jgi:predicted DNA-binding transcriptional regulator YafY